MINKEVTEKYEKELLDLIHGRHSYAQADLKIVVGLIVDSLIIEGQKLQIKEELKSL